MEKKNPVVHFEMPADDRNRMANFYSRVFGWETHFLGEDMGNYVTVTTTDLDANGRPSTPGAINGGFFPRSQNQSNCPSLVIAVDDIEQHVRKVNEAGGRVISQPVEIPGIGLYASFQDTEGNICSILQPIMAENQREPAVAQEEHVSVDDLGETGEI